MSSDGCPQARRSAVSNACFGNSGTERGKSGHGRAGTPRSARARGRRDVFAGFGKGMTRAKARAGKVDGSGMALVSGKSRNLGKTPDADAAAETWARVKTREDTAGGDASDAWTELPLSRFNFALKLCRSGARNRTGGG